LLSALVLAVFTVGHSDEKSLPKLPPPATSPALEKLKKLAGTWMATDKDGKATDQVQSVIKVSGGGSIVHETIFPGQPHEMISVYNMDGNDLIMTHYCVLGNQPRMKASPKSTANQIVWEFAGGTNLDVKKDKHMHAATLTFLNDDLIEINGIGWENG